MAPYHLGMSWQWTSDS